MAKLTGACCLATSPLKLVIKASETGGLMQVFPQFQRLMAIQDPELDSEAGRGISGKTGEKSE